MINIKKASLLATLGGALLLPTAASAGGMYDTVRDSNGNVVTSTNGNCVYTKWEVNSNNCHGMVGNLRTLSKEQRTVYFDFNKSTLNANEKSKLDGLARTIAASKEVSSVDIVGYADQIGDSGYNKALSKRRADTVKSFLSAKGLKTRKVRVDGMGEAGSVTNCDTSGERSALIGCLSADRRVEIQLNFVK